MDIFVENYRWHNLNVLIFYPKYFLRQTFLETNNDRLQANTNFKLGVLNAKL